jgi:hypothetical protein
MVPLILAVLLLAGLLGKSAHGHDDGRTTSGCAVCQLASQGAAEPPPASIPGPAAAILLLPEPEPPSARTGLEPRISALGPRAPPAPPVL